MDNMKICFAGASGTGKSTLAQYISNEYGLPFLSGSYTDLVPGEKGKTHQDILKDTDPKSIHRKEWQLLNLRVKAWKEQVKFVTDRSLLDSATYGALKLAKDLPKCEIEDFIIACFQLQAKFTTHLIYLPYQMCHYFHWDFEDNGKRITNPWFQLQVGNLMDDALEYWCRNSQGEVVKHPYNWFGEAKVFKLVINGNELKVLKLNTLDLNQRQQIINQFLS